MTLKYLLDTSIVSVPSTTKPNQRVVRQIEEHAANSAIAAPVWHELIYGWSRLPQGKRKVALGSYLHDVVARTFPILKYDRAAAHWHGIERARLDRTGKIAPYVDGQIAAIAQANSLILVTTNTKDFENFSDIELENWSQ
ncbi:MAG TPA: type II toxin-antitoxin system VapC family toxin [Polyangiaceae bacterium]|nr:type II toxin-antitoxin system VapC family toxin [Polyangiaceae bacterium]